MKQWCWTHYYNTEGVKTTSIKNDITWEDVRVYRISLFAQTDIWMLADRWASLTAEQQTEMSEYRQALRDITDGEGTAWDAAHNCPDMPSWAVVQ